MNWYAIDPALRRRVQAGEPAAMKLFFESVICRPNRITWTYTADRTRWFARPAMRFVSVPPLIDVDALAIAAHEVGHVLAPPRTPHSLEGENAAWAEACRLLPFFDRAMHRRLQSALGSYRETTPAPRPVQQAADAMMGSVSFAERHQRFKRFEDRLARQTTVMASLAREQVKRDRFRARERLVRRWLQETIS